MNLFMEINSCVPRAMNLLPQQGLIITTKLPEVKQLSIKLIAAFIISGTAATTTFV
jgi:hypothetical protein